MTRFIYNTVRSFENVRNDMNAVNAKLVELEYYIKECQAQISNLQEENRTLRASLHTKRYVASKQGKKAYVEGSLHAKNIKNKVLFDNKQQAIAAGYTVE